MRVITREALVTWLLKCKTNKGVLADLRQGLRSETVDRAWPHLIQICDIRDPDQELIVRTLAGLYAVHPKHSDKVGNFGHTLRCLAVRAGSSVETYEKYLKRLSACRTADDVCLLLPHLVRMVKNVGLPINYYTLYEDLWYWGVTEKWGKPVDPNQSKKAWNVGFYDYAT